MWIIQTLKIRATNFQTEEDSFDANAITNFNDLNTI